MADCVSTWVQSTVGACWALPAPARSCKVCVAWVDPQANRSHHRRACQLAQPLLPPTILHPHTTITHTATHHHHHPNHTFCVCVCIFAVAQIDGLRLGNASEAHDCTAQQGNPQVVPRAHQSLAGNMEGQWQTQRLQRVLPQLHCCPRAAPQPPHHPLPHACPPAPALPSRLPKQTWAACYVLHADCPLALGHASVLVDHARGVPHRGRPRRQGVGAVAPCTG